MTSPEYTAHYHSFHTEYWKGGFPSAEAAHDFLRQGWEDDQLLPVGIIAPGGTEAPFDAPGFLRILSLTITSPQGTTVERYDD